MLSLLLPAPGHGILKTATALRSPKRQFQSCFTRMTTMQDRREDLKERKESSNRSKGNHFTLNSAKSAAVNTRVYIGRCEFMWQDPRCPGNFNPELNYRQTTLQVATAYNMEKDGFYTLVTDGERSYRATIVTATSEKF